MNHSLLANLETQLIPISDTPALDASVLIAHIVKKPRTWVMAHTELTLSEAQQKQLEEALNRLEHGEPFPYVLGHWEFFGLDLDITSDVLIPRPETELLVERAIAWLQASPSKRSVADVGTGSGAIAVSIAVNVPDVQILAADISPQAVEVARQNARKFGVEDQIDFVHADLLPADPSVSDRYPRMDLICANLPYIPTTTLHRLPIFGREPTLALDGGADGLELVRRLLSIAPAWLAPDARLLLEIESSRGQAALDLARRMFPEAAIDLYKDLSGQDRLLEIVTQKL